MDIGLKVLSDLTVFSKYARYTPSLKRRETWDEIVNRYVLMMCRKYPELYNEIITNSSYILNKKVLPSMRALQFAGIAAEVNNTRMYNCCFMPVDSLYAFNEAMFLLLSGTGVGYSVQKHHVAKLPSIVTPAKAKRFVIEDNIMGWADAVKALMKAYFTGKALPIFDFRAIRAKGMPLVTSGGKAPGPEPLKICLVHIQAILDRKKEGENLTPLECHDIMCHIANAVLAGGIRRAAMISLFSLDDEEMLTCKYGEWWEQNEQRGRANNSAIILRGSITEEEFKTLWHKIELSGSGEPGIYWTNDLEWGTNPCCEVALRPFQFCNLCEINASNIESQDDLNNRARIASFFGTLQAGFTDFHYLRPIWKKTTEEDALIGIGMTGIASGEVLKYNLTDTADWVDLQNQSISGKIGINTAARQTLIKPSGTTSCVVGSSSGIHGWHDKYYLRTIRLGKGEDLASYLIVNHPELVEDDELRPHDTLCVRIPIKAPEGAILRYETAIDLLERVKKFSTEWIKPGHITGINTHNVSATISINKETIYYEESKVYSKYGFKAVDEWERVGMWMWENKDTYNGLSVLPFDGGTYVQPPFETISKEEYDRRVKHIKGIDLTQVIEYDDLVNFGEIAACSGGACEVN
jgi:ribonucleoside-diphosphate reductase alpha chain